MLKNPRMPQRFKRYAPAAFVVLAGLTLTWVGYRLVTDAEDQRIDAEFMRRAEGAHTMIREVLANDEAGLLGLRGIFESNDDVSRKTFEAVANEIYQRYPGIATLQWVPVVAAAERARVETEASRELGFPFAFTERNARDEVVPATERPLYLPILYLLPLAGHERALGYDVSTGFNKNIMGFTPGDQMLRVSGQFTLVEDPDPSKRAIIWVIPVFKTGAARGRLAGYVEAMFYVSTLLRDPFLRHNVQGREVLFEDLDETDPARRVLAYYAPGNPSAVPPSEGAFHTGIHAEFALGIGQRHWQVLYRSTDEWLAQQRTHLPFIVLLGGLVITGLLGAFVDTRVRQVERIERTVAERTAELQASEEEVRGIMENSPNAISVKAPDGRYLAANRRFAEWHGRSREDIVGRAAADFVPPEGAIRLRELDEHVFRTGETRRTEETFVLNGHRRTFLITKFPLRDAVGAIRALCTVATEITDQKNTEAERLAGERKMLEGQKLESLGVLAGGIAHDFNNLLTIILGHVTLAELQLPDDSSVRSNLGQIKAGSLRAAELCRQMLAYSGRGRFVVGPIDLSELVQSTVPLLRLSISKQASLRFALAPGLPCVEADATQLRQILMNLVINASDAIGSRPGTITITTGLRRVDEALLRGAVYHSAVAGGDYVLLEVADTGCGMTPETRARIFDPFFSTKFTGRGLGLAAVLGIVRGHRGALLVESTPGQGSTFRLLLPSSPAGTVPLPLQGEGVAISQEPPWRHAGRVLLADDEEAVRLVSSDILESFGLEVDAVADGATALACLETASVPYDAVLLDLTMPGLGGDEVLRRLRERWPRLPVVLMSGYVEQDAVQRFGGALDGATVFLQKPFSLEAVREKLRHLLSPS
jgi:PAS domain S-box-containing protein